jgi:hypothetical protein
MERINCCWYGGSGLHNLLRCNNWFSVFFKSKNYCTKAPFNTEISYFLTAELNHIFNKNIFLVFWVSYGVGNAWKWLNTPTCYASVIYSRWVKLMNFNSVPVIFQSCFLFAYSNTRFDRVFVSLILKLFRLVWVVQYCLKFWNISCQVIINELNKLHFSW